MVDTRIDMTGQQHGKLYVITQIGTGTNGNTFWFCRCQCGSVHVDTGIRIRSTQHPSCGCKQRDGC